MAIPGDGEFGFFGKREGKGSNAQFGESRFRENPCFDDGFFSQEYFVYFKKKRRDQSTDYPEDAEAGACGAAEIEKEKAKRFRPLRFPMK